MRLPDGSYDNDIKFEEYQNKWLETQDKKYLWMMYPLYLHAVKSCMVKRLKGQRIPYFNEKAEEAALYQIGYHVKHPKVKIESCMKWSSTLCMYALYGPKSKKMDKEFYEESYDEIVENQTISYDSFEDDLIEKLTREGY